MNDNHRQKEGNSQEQEVQKFAREHMERVVPQERCHTGYERKPHGWIWVLPSMCSFHRSLP